MLAGGTTLGVVALTAVPVAALARQGFRLRPRWTPSDPQVRRLGRHGGWATGQVVAVQGLLVVVLVLANAAAGGVVAFQFGTTFFLLPVALIAIPVTTAVFPAPQPRAPRRVVCRCPRPAPRWRSWRCWSPPWPRWSRWPGRITRVDGLRPGHRRRPRRARCRDRMAGARRARLRAGAAVHPGHVRPRRRPNAGAGARRRAGRRRRRHGGVARRRRSRTGWPCSAASRAPPTWWPRWCSGGSSAGRASGERPVLAGTARPVAAGLLAGAVDGRARRCRRAHRPLVVPAAGGAGRRRRVGGVRRGAAGDGPRAARPRPAGRRAWVRGGCCRCSGRRREGSGPTSRRCGPASSSAAGRSSWPRRRVATWRSLSRRGSILSTSLAPVRRLRGLLAAFDLVHAHGLKAGWTASLRSGAAVGAHRAQRRAPGPGRRDGAAAAPAGAPPAAAGRRGDRHVGPARLGARRACAPVRPHVDPARGSGAAGDPAGLRGAPASSASPMARRSSSASGGSTSRRAGRSCSKPLARLRPPRPVRVVIAGEGPLEGDLRARLAALGLEGIVALVGPTPGCRRSPRRGRCGRRGVVLGVGPARRWPRR